MVSSLVYTLRTRAVGGGQRLSSSTAGIVLSGASWVCWMAIGWHGAVGSNGAVSIDVSGMRSELPVLCAQLIYDCVLNTQLPCFEKKRQKYKPSGPHSSLCDRLSCELCKDKAETVRKA